MNFDAHKLLEAAGVFYDDDMPRTLNMNDTFGWAEAFGEEVPEESIQEVATLFWYYGQVGLIYWVSERNGGMRSEFEDVNRYIDFVRHEEQLRKQEPSSSKRAYMELVYTLGQKEAKSCCKGDA